MIVSEYIKMTGPEKYAIRWHMGAFEVADAEKFTLSAACEKYPLCLALQEADCEATWLLENER